MNCLKCGKDIPLAGYRKWSWEWQYKCTACGFAWETIDSDSKFIFNGVVRYAEREPKLPRKIIDVPPGCLLVVNWKEI